MRLVIEQDPDHLLWNVPVDQPAGEGVAPLMGCQMHRAPVLVVDSAGRQPPAQHAPVAAVRQREIPEDVRVGPGEQAGGAAVWPAVQHAALLLVDGGPEVFVDGDGCLTFHLRVEVPQVGGFLAVVEETVEVEGEGAGDPQAAAGEDDGDQPAGGSV